MKTIEITLSMLFILFFTRVPAQEAKSDPNKETVFMIVEQMPEFPGGEQALRDFIVKNVQYPEEAKKAGISGKVFVNFVIDENGKVIMCKVVRGVSPLLDQEALRVTKEMPDWTPGKQKGKAVKVSYTMPIAFVLN